MGNPPTGKHAEWLGIGSHTLRDGHITQGWFAEDILSLLIQLDVFPAPQARPRLPHRVIARL